MRRLRAIEDEEARHLREVEDAWRTLADEEGDDAVFAVTWRETACGWNFARINALIAKHNAYYPIEARVPMNPRTGTYARTWSRGKYGAPWILDRFPPVRAIALKPSGPAPQAPSGR
jgi:hypothetical protein